ncbi:histidine kinase-like ATPase [Fusarium oxysporum]|nr:histidine kinase-like ATPase [Fusarium oxysporum]
MATDADVDMGCAPTASHDILNVPPSGTKRNADGQPIENLPAKSDAPRRIRALDPNVVNKIAAGEIIVAPVHALKELIENAVDAGATSLDVLAKDGGLKLLQITDNGCGIQKEDLAILCERHTTSKITSFEDLAAIATYGFRGEALASISHIAHLSVTTKTKDSDLAWRAHYLDGKLAPAKPGQSAEPKGVAGRPGTQITVEDLFYNIPTRRRAFRSPADEFNKIIDMVGRYAVHCKGVGFTCKKAGEASTNLSIQAQATVIDRIRQIHGSAVANELLEFSVAEDRWGFKAEGFTTNANYSVKKTTLLLFINHRCVESTHIKKAIEQTYANFLPKNGHPFIYLSLEIEPARVDVNVHPTKREVHFLNEDEIIQSICEHIESKLAAVDTSRTFMTQTLLPGAKVIDSTPQTDSDGTPLRDEVREDTHHDLTEIFSNHTFVGIVDEQRRLAAIQGGVKLYLIDYGRTCYEYFYQLALTDFGNFGAIKFNPSLDLRELLRGAAEMERSSITSPEEDFEVETLVDRVADQLIERREMLLEYFSLEISPAGELVSLPLLLKGYTPPLVKLPRFLLRLGPSVDWTEEKACFDSFVRELATFYVPEQLPSLPGDADSIREEHIPEELRARRQHIRHAVEHVFFPAFKARLVATKSLMEDGVLEVANLKGLYRVFERC